MPDWKPTDEMRNVGFPSCLLLPEIDAILIAVQPLIEAEALERAAQQFDAEADNAKLRHSELNRYKDDQFIAWRKWKDTEDRKRYGAAFIRAMKTEPGA